VTIVQPKFVPSAFSWTSSLETDLVQNAGSQITPISAVELAFMVNWKEYVSKVPTNVGSAMSYVTGGLKAQALLDKLNLREAGPHVMLAQYPNQNMDCGWGAMAVAAGVIAGIVFFFPGGQLISAMYTLIAAIYAALEYLNVGC
jgi:hypothetical protein